MSRPDHSDKFVKNKEKQAPMEKKLTVVLLHRASLYCLPYITKYSSSAKFKD